MQKKEKKNIHGISKKMGHNCVSGQINLISDKIDSLSPLADFHPDNTQGKVILNMTYVREDKLSDALANLYQMMQMRNDGYWSLLREQ